MRNTIPLRIEIKINWELVVPAATSLLLMGIIVKTIDNLENPRPVSYVPAISESQEKRKEFLESTKKATKLKQGFVCNTCKKTT